MAIRMQQRRGTASQWTSSNPILNAGEIGFESDTNKFKIGDGINHWADLTYFVDGAELNNIIDGAPALLDTLNELAAAIGDDPAFFTTVATNLSNHEADTTNIHGIANTSELATKTFAAELLTNATKSNITITGDKNGLTITAENGVADSTTDNLTEGSTNKYFTDERAQDAVGLNVGTGLTYTDSTGEIKVTPNTYDAYGSAASAQSAAETTASNALSSHESDTTNIHGITDTSKLVTTDGSQTLTNKTITSPSGLVKSDVGLGNVDNTSDANKPVSTSTQTALDLKANLVGATFSGAVSTTDTTQSTSTTTGSIKTAGGLGVVKNAYIGGNLDIAGNFTVSGTTTTVNTANLNVTDPMIYMGDNNQSNIVDLGFVSAFNDGTYQHSGLVRDASDSKWKLFKGVTDEPTTTVNFTQGSLDDLAVGGLTASSLTVGSVSNTEIGYLDGVTSAIQTQLDTKAPLASPTFTGTVTLPSGTVTSTMIADGTIVNTDISATAAIDWTKLAISSTVSATELGYVDGVTSAIQTQLDSKLASSTASSTYAPIASPTFTGTVSGITKSMVGLGNVENTALSTWAGSTNITTLGTVATGTWSGTTIALNKGGTGATTQAGAANAVLPTQTSNSGKYLTTDGTNVSWGTVSSYTAPTLGSTSISSGATVTTIAGLTLSGATLTGTLTASASAGTSGQVLSSTGTGVQWITPAGGAAFSELMLIGA